MSSSKSRPCLWLWQRARFCRTDAGCDCQDAYRTDVINLKTRPAITCSGLHRRAPDRPVGPRAPSRSRAPIIACCPPSPVDRGCVITPAQAPRTRAALNRAKRVVIPALPPLVAALRGSVSLSFDSTIRQPIQIGIRIPQCARPYQMNGARGFLRPINVRCQIDTRGKMASAGYTCQLP
jgi:hypothetical protein